MSTIYLEHPVHGRKIAYMELEAEFDEKHGWKRFEPVETSIAAPTQDEEEPAVNTLSLKRKYNRKVV